MNKLLLIMALFTLGGCNAVNRLTGGGDKDTPTAPAGKPHIEAVWIADVNVDGASTPFNFLLQDEGNGQISGLWNLGWYAQGHVRATLSGNTLAFALDQSSVCPDAYVGSATITGNQMTLTLSGPGCPTAVPLAPVVTLAQGTILWNGKP